MANRYQSFGEIASGGMATVEYGRLLGPHGFSRPVAIKRLHAQFSKDPAFAAMFIDEARLSARLNHANIIQTLDVIERPGELAIVMEYVHGESLSQVLELVNARRERVPVKIATALVASVLHGLHAAHETRNERDELLGVVHRDVSPQNILVGSDGVPRILDFGIAKAVDQLRSTPSGEIKGKLAYIAPEQLLGQAVDRRADVFGAAVVLWETLTCCTLFHAESSSVLVQRVLQEPVRPPSALVASLPPELDAIVMRGLAREPEERYATAREMALELERELGIATQSEISDWLQQVAGPVLTERASELRRLRERGGAALSAFPEGEPSGPSTRVIAHDELAPGSLSASSPQGSTPSIETRSRVTEVRSVWPWLLAGLGLIGALAALGGGWMRGHSPAASTAAAPAAAGAAAAVERELDLQPLAAGVGGSSVESESQPLAAGAGGFGEAAGSRVREKDARRKRVVKPVELQRPAVVEPPCSPVIYVDGIRSVNPDCPQGVSPQR